MQTILHFLLRLIFVAAAAVFAASMALAFSVMLTLWLVRAGWARLTGRPAAPFIVRIDPRAAFGDLMQRGGQASRTPRADAVQPGRAGGDITDVEPR